MRFHYYAIAILVAFMAVDAAFSFRARKRYFRFEEKTSKPLVQTVNKGQAGALLDQSFNFDNVEKIPVHDSHPRKPDFVIPFHDAPKESPVRIKREVYYESWGHWFFRAVWSKVQGQYKYGK
ncbi:hypothetical protein Ocin01_05311 [Orchesella cincta]|uniref:Uncharacterized protein n=1 Tax=Orchesella cincta TaxID=48709 RepID=A0A1D2N7Z4_ORCCI|nr:hypothetical protein Ocin01_05311 [Orchesella cincta]